MWVMLIRHAESEGNVKHDTYSSLADCSIGLTKKGHVETKKLAEFLTNFFDMNQPIGKVKLWTSPYLRAEQTAKDIWTNVSNIEWDQSTQDQTGYMTSDERIREREFGLFDGLTPDEARKSYPIEAKHFEKFKENKETKGFYARPPMGESPADVTLRLRSFHGTITREIQKENGIQNHIIVTHGVVMRCYPFSFMKKHPHCYALENNPGNTAVRLIGQGGSASKYIDHEYIYDPERKLMRLEKLIV